MRQLEQINDFSKGIITSIDALDIPNEASVYSENIDPSIGYLTPVNLPSTVTGTGTVPSNALVASFVVKDSNSTGLFYAHLSGNLLFKLIDDFSPTFNVMATNISSNEQVSHFIPKDKELRIARYSNWSPKIFKYHDYVYNGLKGKVSVTNVPVSSNKLLFTGTMYYDTVDLVSIHDRSGNYEHYTASAVNHNGFVKITYDNPYTISIFKVGDAVANNGIVSPYPIVTQTGYDGSSWYVIVNTAWNNQVVTWVDYDSGTSLKIRFLVRHNNVDDHLVDIDSPVNVTGYQTVDNHNLKVRLPVNNTLNWVKGNTFTVRKSNWIYETNNLSNYSSQITGPTINPTSGAGYFVTTKKYFYKYSLVYEGFQQSLLNDTPTTIVPTSNCLNLHIHTFILLNYLTSFSQRVTGFNLYRAEASDTTKTKPDTYYRLVKSWDFTEEFLESAWDEAQQKVKLTHVDYGNWGASYESLTGISESLTTIVPNYTYGVYSGNRLFTINNYIADEPEASRMLLMSQPLKYDTFSWDKEYVLLGNVPKGIGEFRGTIFVFSNNVIWKINPDTLSIDQTWTGYDLLSQSSILTTEYGLLFCTNNGAYIIDTTNITELSYNIRNKNGVNSGISNTAISWKEFITSNTKLYTYFDEKKQSFVFFDTYTESAMVYYIPGKSWWYWKFAPNSANSTSTLFIDHNQNVYYSTGTSLKKFYGGNFAATTWISKLISLGAVKQKKRLQKLKYSGSGTLYYGINNNAPTTSVGSEEGSLTYSYFETLQLKITQSSSPTRFVFKAIEIIYRLMKGLR
jgi:hypothetical protein